MNALGLSLVTLLVRDYDEAIGWFTDCLGFTLVEDTLLGPDKRWVVVRAGGGQGAGLLLAKASDKRQRAAIGNQAGGRVGFFLHCRDFDHQHTKMQAKGVKFNEAPRHEIYGAVAVFEDLYGNSWDLIEYRQP